MPELPEVQTVVDGLVKTAKGKKITQIKIFNQPKFDKDGLKRLEGCVILDIARVGKFIVFSFAGFDLVVHLRMTGQFFYYSENKEVSLTPYDKVVIELDKGTLVFRDVRKFATFEIVSSHKQKLVSLGQDPTSENFVLADFIKLTRSSKGGVKAFLLNQNKLAGLGNIYADEVLYESKIHPLSSLENLPLAVIEALYFAIKKVLNKALKAQGTSLGAGLGNYRHINGEGKHQLVLNVYGKAGMSCMNCHALLLKIKAAGRGTTFCPHCQILY